MKKSEIKKVSPTCEITLNSNEARNILFDLNSNICKNDLSPDSKMLVKYLVELVEASGK